MRKIEKEMLAALREGRDWRKSNTAVVQDGIWAHVYLFGNRIATRLNNTGVVEVNRPTVRRWPTVTTMSRLRALGFHIHRDCGRILLDGEEL